VGKLTGHERLRLSGQSITVGRIGEAVSAALRVLQPLVNVHPVAWCVGQRLGHERGEAPFLPGDGPHGHARRNDGIGDVQRVSGSQV